MKKVLYVGYNGFPKGLAQMQRQMLISKGLTEHGCKVLILSRYGVHNKMDEEKLESTGKFEGIYYKYCSGASFRPDNILVRNLLKLKGFWVEFFTIFHERFKNKAEVLLITSNRFAGILYYTILARLLNLTSVVDQVEYWSAINYGFKKNIDSYFNDRYYGICAHKVIVISDFLLSKLKQLRPKIPVIKIPAICDFSKFEVPLKRVNGDQYFLFCGSAGYYEVIKFVLDSYALLKTNTSLVLIISGKKIWIEKVKKYIQENNIHQVLIKSQIPYSELINMYQNCLALLIPLRPTLQDIARFPHKIGEYTASKRPIISTNIGEVSIFFKDGENAFLSESFEVNNYSKKMQEVIDFPSKREVVAEQSFLTGIKDFNYKTNSERLYEFLFTK